MRARPVFGKAPTFTSCAVPMIRRISIVLFAASLLAPRSAAAQRETFENVNGWVAWFGETAINSRWSFDHDLQWRMSGPFSEFAQGLWRGSLRINQSPNIRWSLGYAGTTTHPYGELPIAFTAPEHRAFADLKVLHSAGRASFTHRYRYERRFLGRVTSASGDVDRWVPTNRIRYQARVTLPLQGKTLETGEFYFQLTDELFMNWGSEIASNIFDQNRLQFMVGRRMSDKLRLEVGYLDQLIQRPNGVQLERNHTLITVINTSLKFPSAK